LGHQKKWLKDIPGAKNSDATHERRLGLIKERQDKEHAARLQAKAQKLDISQGG
jgi:hypothetical protein